MNESQVYWWLMLDGIKIACLIIGLVLTLFTVGLTYDISNTFALLFLVSIPVLIAGILTPTTNQMAVIKIMPKIANSEFAKAVPEDMQSMYDMAKSYMKEKLEVKQ